MNDMGLGGLEVFRMPTYRDFIFNGKEGFFLNTYPYMDIILGDACDCRCKFCVAGAKAFEKWCEENKKELDEETY